ncbi:hypothetical protein [Variovorax terrae]|uniref:Uncharacterized protein n=1 Tax=Variovorax terrae TaxID=2923278 RepID=A0A9X2AQ26_9BURK|nr:hypothetical protein [Variovorax terrae]MCJ0764092.1 hypothetical protein [Variovorax terrae]
MNPSPIESLGPPPFRFTPALGASLHGPAFSPFFKLLATLVVFGTAGWFINLWLQGQAGSRPLMTWFLAGLALMLYTWWHILRSTTRLDAGALHQSWVWDKKMELRELAYGKMVRVRGLDWLIAPRLYVRTLMGKFAVFYAADPVMLMEFERLIQELKAFRGLK